MTCGPVAKHAIPASVLDPKRLIFYGGTAQGVGRGDENIRFFAYDLNSQKVLYAGPDGPYRALAFARSTGRVYYTQGIAGRSDEGILMRYHSDENGGRPAQVEGGEVRLPQVGLQGSQVLPVLVQHVLGRRLRGAVQLVGPAALLLAGRRPPSPGSSRAS